MSEFFSGADYEARFEIEDEAGDPVDLTNADIRYILSEQRGSGVILERVNDDDGVQLQPNDETGVVQVFVDSSETPAGTVFETLRVTTGGTTAVVANRSVTFRKVP